MQMSITMLQIQNPEDLSKKRIISDVRIRARTTTKHCLENDEERFILFATPRQLNILSRSSNNYFDSTFKSVPEIFYHFLLSMVNTIMY
ncbi:hypothetical protein HZS_3973 [Henneguya salminicola]|nr:hypothetical protein HZS_3973 [Henneguya salminicola]